MFSARIPIVRYRHRGFYLFLDAVLCGLYRRIVPSRKQQRPDASHSLLQKSRDNGHTIGRSSGLQSQWQELIQVTNNDTFKNALQTRTEFLHRVKASNSSSNPWVQSLVLPALVELGDWPGIVNYVQQIPAGKINPPTVDALLMAYLHLGELQKWAELGARRFRTPAWIRLSPFNGRSVHLSGPKNRQGNLVDQGARFDLVVRMGPLQEKNLESVEQTSSYLTRSQINNHSDLVGALLPRLKSIHVQDRRLLRAFPQTTPNGGIWQTQSAEALFLPGFSGPQALQRILYDLLQHSPRQIYVSGVDFFLSRGALYNPNYPSNVSTRLDIEKSLRLHDPFSNFAFVRNLFKTGLVNFDDKAGNILASGLDQYARSLDARFTRK